MGRVLPRARADTQTRTAPRFSYKTTAYLFVLPYLIFFLAFRLGPALVGLGMAFTNWRIVGQPDWVGFSNFEAMTRDTRFLDALRNTAVFTVLTVPLLIIVGLALAIFMNQPRRGRTIGRVAVFIPYVLMSTVVGVLWTWMLERDFGLVNSYLKYLGIAPVPWLLNENVALYGIILTTIWWTVGYSMVLFLAGLQDIPEELYEAARIDGASPWALFRFVTIPLLSPTIFLVALLSIINSFQVFDQAYVMTSGGPGTSTLTLVQYVYTAAFQFSRMGYGAAIAVVLFVILIAIALIQARSYRRGLTGTMQ
ncbi:MAG: sugar ABC transporter permease [Anaerolineae bacterium]|nr:sugar ABC transporter permease [Anaerolineae bacterium]